MLIILLKSLLILFVYKILFFKILNFKARWFIQLLIVYLISLLILIDRRIFENDFILLINYFLFFFTFIISYILFLTLVFNDSPTLFYLFHTKKEFLKKKFIADRKKKLLKNGFLDYRNKITKNGIHFLKIFEILSIIFLSEKKWLSYYLLI
jgi:hypothetical protein